MPLDMAPLPLDDGAAENVSREPATAYLFADLPVGSKLNEETMQRLTGSVG